MQPKPSTIFTVKDNKKSVPARVGKPIEIHLKGNPTTGYTWTRLGFIGKETLSDDDMEVHVEFAATDSVPGMVGAGGLYKVTVIPNHKGHQTLQLIYTRHFDVKSDDPKYTLHLNVE
ncbi:hypothetical protein GH5_04938 [Leishmania sp. Ghana 2012 LV757]|uniref:Proteinase inhibitor I42 chagasin domain-containing protein n=1 Tax=Leishmania orientalis TaxID=2249476 RepID=A0A836KTW9_9TRYP|nr:hypothetical protein LSCM4_05472 [Leishmania orientalis]KAG5504076.1 hypothetical protein GH5_04938 [Leishmania sp. Ghana 2012 LV757]